MKNNAFSFMILYLMAVIFGTSETWAITSPVRIGIVRFTGGVASDQQAESITDSFTSMLANSKAITVIEREKLDVIGREHRLNVSLVDPSTASQVGALAGCQYVLLGSLGQGTLNVRLVDVATAAVALSLTDNDPSLLTALSRIGDKVRERITGEYAHVIGVRGSQININRGAESGVRFGDLYRVYIDGAEMYDMNNNPIRETLNIALVTVQDVRPDFSVSGLTRGRLDLIRRGDKIEAISGEAAKYIAFIEQRPGFVPAPSSSYSAPVSLAEAPSDSLAGPTPNPLSTISAPKRSKLENYSTESEKVIVSYGLPKNDELRLIEQHKKAEKMLSISEMFDRYTEIFRDYSIDYFAAYRAGRVSFEIGKNARAYEWAEKALAINPKYKPAKDLRQAAKHKMD